MRIGGLQKFSLIDYPGKVCCIVFTQGCNFRCPYCHNPELVKPELFEEPIPEDEIMLFLNGRKGKLDAVEVTGGEPTLQPDLLSFVKEVKEMGFLVKLDSNGTNPDIIEKAAKDKLVDYLAMDVKAPLEKYSFVAGVKVNIENIRRSIRVIMNSGLEYQFRTTVVKQFLSVDDLRQICLLIRGASQYVLQRFKHSGKLVDESFLNGEEYSEDDVRQFQGIVSSLIEELPRGVSAIGQ